MNCNFRVVFRCDASHYLGAGHIARCYSLAKVLEKYGAKIIFIVSQQEGNLFGWLNKYFQVFEIPFVSNEGKPSYEAQLDDSLATYSSLCCSQYVDINWIVVDHYKLDFIWQADILDRFKGLGSNPKLLVIDDLADRLHFSDMLLDQNFLGISTYSRYDYLVPKSCRLLLSPTYAILSPEYSSSRLCARERSDVRRILVSFGGSDSLNLTAKALSILSLPDFSCIKVDVVLGAQAQNYGEISELVENRPLTYLHQSLSTLAPLMLESDLAIGAGGTTTWERACLGLPTIVISTASNQYEIAKALSDHQYITFLGDASHLSSIDLFNTLRSYCTNSSNLRKNGFGLTDGFGGERVAFSMSNLFPQVSLSLKQADNFDEHMLLFWRNDRQSRANSFDTSIINESSHKNWFLKSLQNPNRLILIATLPSGCPIGYIRFDKIWSSKSSHWYAHVSFALDKSARGKQLSSQMLEKGIYYMKANWSEVFGVVAEVKPNNLASNACFARSGFLLNSLLSSQDQNVWELIPLA